MTANDDAYVAFARGLSHRIRERVKGLDDAYARIIAARPSDQVLGGFLTPVNREEKDDNEADPEVPAIQELPGDRPDQMTNLGIEWLVPLDAAAVCHVSFGSSVYVRRIPTSDVALAHATWRQLPNEAERRTPLVPIWTREALAPCELDLDLAGVISAGGASISLDALLSQGVAHIPSELLYLARRQIRVSEREIEAGAHVGQAGHGTRDLVWRANLDVRVIPAPLRPDCVRIIVRIVNTTPVVARGGEDFFDSNLYAASLTIRVPRTAHVSTQFRELPASYRYDLTLLGIGVNCQVEAADDGDEMVLSTETVPTKEVGRLEPRNIGSAQPTFAALADDPIPSLRGLAAEMHGYLRQTWDAKVDSLRPPSREEAVIDRGRFDSEIGRFELGIRLLEDPAFPEVRRAFRLMNLAMKALGAKSTRRYDRWRLFQIIFIVAQLPELAARRMAIPYAHDADDEVDILWFAAGGGKTEAFLGLLIWQLFLDRLTGKHLGVTAFLRFPLRLLAYQQLQRLANALAEADQVRERAGLGGRRFSLGYYVGDTYLTPNEIYPDRAKRYAASVEDDPPRIQACPYCGGAARLHYDQAENWLHHRCTNRACSFGDTPLPIAHTDADCYRFLPSVIVSTVDKFAVFGQNVRFANLLGRITAYCPRHGATFLDTNKGRCKGAAQLINAGVKQAKCGDHDLDFGPFTALGPTLLIQDELHLLTEELGIFDSHYETALLAALRAIGQQPWKVIAATATISTFADHARHLYLRSARQFPAPGPEVYDSFYYQIAEASCGRIFVGILGVGRAHTPAVSKLMSVIYTELETARGLLRSDLSAALTRYGLPTLTASELAEVLFYYEVLLTYVLTKKGSDQVAEAVESRVKQEVASEDDLRIETFNSGVELSDMTSAMEEIERADANGAIADRIRGVIATNIISHGVDVERFNLMLFAGFTRLVAEYIQASARVGRRRPGIVFLVATPQSERDRSILQQFSKFHEYVDRLVDPSALNRWPVPAMQRTIPGVLAGYLMAVASGLCAARLDSVESVNRYFGGRTAEALNEAELLTWMEAAFGVSHAPAPDLYSAAVRQRAANLYSLVISAPAQSQGGRPRLLAKHLGAMRSLRDVDDPAFISVDGLVSRAAVRAFAGKGSS